MSNALTAIDTFNMYIDNFAGNHQAFTGWLGGHMGFPGTEDEFTNEHSAYITQFDPGLGLNAAFQDYFNKTGVDLTQVPYEEQSAMFGGAMLSSQNSSDVLDGMSINTDFGNEGAIRNKFSTSSEETKNDFNSAVDQAQSKFGAQTAQNQTTLGAASGTTGGTMKSGQVQRKIVDDLGEGHKLGQTLGRGLEISQEQAMNEYNADMDSALVGVRQQFNTEINNWYSNVMTGIESLAMEGVFDEPDAG